MKLAILAVCLLGFMLLECHSSPVQLVENYELVSKARELAGRQAATGDVAPVAAAPVAASSDDDDDDDEDDDDDIGDLIDDDDDDDDEDDDDDDDEDDTPQGQAAPGAPVAASSDDDEDDDDDDYIDRIFDDILGDDDDDDDDDEDESSPAAVAAPAKPAAAAAPVQPAAVPAQAAGAAADALEESASGVSDADNVIVPVADDVVEGEQNVFYDEENAGGIDTKVDIQSLNNKPIEATTAKVAVAPVAVSQIESSDDDDDDDDDDDITGALTGDDDDEDDDDTDDDDDDDDDIVGDDVIEARRAHGAEKNVVIEMPKDAFQERHNQFIDAIFSRINRIVSDSYDPFKVRLASISKQASKAKPSSPSTKAKKTSTKSKTKKVTAGSKARSADTIAKSDTNSTKTIKSRDSIVGQNPSSSLSAEDRKTQREQQKQKPQTVATESTEKRTAAPTSTSTKNRKKTQPLRSSANSKQTTKQSKPKPKQTTPNLSATPGAAAPATGTASAVEKLHHVEGSLSGLASLRRVGNAKVVTDPEGRNSTIKSKFTLGPLTLKVEKSFKRGNVRNVKTATARTNEMIGRIKFSVVNDQATLVSIKVQQPQQVEVESKDNHDRTREMVWRRTPKIARLVSEKLRLAAESLFQPRAGVEVVRL